ncbi:MAG: type II toxin-antitoxin system RelE/ParE family toxin [Persicimonas sp.]
MTLNWTSTARATLDAIYEYLAEEVDRKTAHTIQTRIVTKAEHIPSFPESGRRVPEIETPHIREVFVDSYRIIYQLDSVDSPSRIDVLGVVHGSQLFENTAVWSILDGD